MSTPDSTNTVPGIMTLRILGTGDEVNVSESKISLGSSASCTVELPYKGIEPVHCLVLRKEGETVIHSWFSNAWLNDAPLREDVLRVGDRLRIADMELEVVRDEYTEESGQVNSTMTAPLANDFQEPTAPDFPMGNDSAEPFDNQWESEQSQGDFNSAPTDWQPDATPESPASDRDAFIAPSFSPVANDESVLPPGHARDHQPPRSPSVVSDALAASAVAVDREDASVSEGNDTTSALDVTDPFEALQRKLAALEEHGGPEASQSPAPELFAEPVTDPVSDSATDSADPVDPVAAQPRGDDGAVDVASILANMGHEVEAPSAPKPVMEKPVSQPAETEVQHDESIEDYMKALMQRVSGGGDSPAKEASASSKPDSSASTNKVASSTEPSVGTPTGTAEPADPQDQPKPKQAPAKPTWPKSRQRAPISDLSALRELANESARTAITSHARSRRKTATVMRGLSSLAVFLLAGIVLALSRFEDLLLMLVGFVMVGVSIMLFLQAVKAGVFSVFGGVQTSSSPTPKKSRSRRKNARK